MKARKTVDKPSDTQIRSCHFHLGFGPDVSMRDRIWSTLWSAFNRGEPVGFDFDGQVHVIDPYEVVDSTEHDLTRPESETAETLPGAAGEQS